MRHLRQGITRSVLALAATAVLGAGESIEVGATSAPAIGSAHAGMARETAQVHRLVVSDCATGKNLLVRFSRRGSVNVVYAMEGGGPQILLRILTAPAGQHGVNDMDNGATLANPQSLFDRYGYHKDDFRQICSRWSTGQPIAWRREDPPALTLQSDGAINGAVDVAMVDEESGSEQTTRMLLEVVAPTSGRLEGTCQSWYYDLNELSYGAAAMRSATRTGTGCRVPAS